MTITRQIGTMVIEVRYGQFDEPASAIVDVLIDGALPEGLDVEDLRRAITDRVAASLGMAAFVTQKEIAV